MLAICLVMILLGNLLSNQVRGDRSIHLGTSSGEVPACSTDDLFQLTKQNLRGFLAPYIPPGNVLAAECVSDHAILRGFQVNAGGGTDGALFHASGGRWHYITIVDSDTAGLVDACDRYPYEFRSMLKKGLGCPAFGDSTRNDVWRFR